MYIPAGESEGTGMFLNTHVAWSLGTWKSVNYFPNADSWGDHGYSYPSPWCSTSQRAAPLLKCAKGDHFPATLLPQRKRQFLTRSPSRDSKHTTCRTGSYHSSGHTSYCTEFLCHRPLSKQDADCWCLQPVVFHVALASKKWVIGYLPTATPLLFSPRRTYHVMSLCWGSSWELPRTERMMFCLLFLCDPTWKGRLRLGFSLQNVNTLTGQRQRSELPQRGL